MLALLLACLANLVTSGGDLSLPVHVAREDLTVQLEQSPKSPGKLIVFGDSFCDNGTGAWTVSDHTWPADPAYDGHRFCNGPVWVEDVAVRLSIELHDNAIGGATSNNSVTQGFTGPDSTIPVPSALDQVDAYLSRETIGFRDIVVVVIGGNDLLLQGTVEAVITAISNIVHRLHRKGASRFLLASYFTLAGLPFLERSAPEVIDELENTSESLRASLMKLRHQLCDSHIQVGFADGRRLYKDIISHPSAYGFDPANIHKSCLVGAYSDAPRKLCNEPDRYIFWDEYHVGSSKIHSINYCILTKYLLDIPGESSVFHRSGLERNSYIVPHETFFIVKHVPPLIHTTLETSCSMWELQVEQWANVGSASLILHLLDNISVNKNI